MKSDNEHNNKEYKYLLEVEVSKLIWKFLFFISLAGIVIVIIGACSGEKKFVNEVSFASTISSIILSVIAIIMTIAGEQKTDNTKNKLVGVSDDLNKITGDIKDSTKNLKELKNLDEKLKKIDEIVTRVTNIEKITTENNKKAGITDKIEPSNSIDIHKNESYNKMNYKNLYKNLVYGAHNNYLLSGLYYIFQMIEKGNGIPVENFVKLMSLLGIDSNSAQYYWGMSMVFTSHISSISIAIFEEEKEFRDFINIEIGKPGLLKYKDIVDTFIKEN